MTFVILTIKSHQVKVSRMFNKKIFKNFINEKSPGLFQDPDLIKINSSNRICFVILVSKIHIYACFLSLTIFEEVGSNLREQCI